MLHHLDYFLGTSSKWLSLLPSHKHKHTNRAFIEGMGKSLDYVVNPRSLGYGSETMVWTVFDWCQWHGTRWVSIYIVLFLLIHAPFNPSFIHSNLKKDEILTYKHRFLLLSSLEFYKYRSCLVNTVKESKLLETLWTNVISSTLTNFGHIYIH